MNELEFLVDIFLRNDLTDELKKFVGSRIKELIKKPNYTVPYNSQIKTHQSPNSVGTHDSVRPEDLHSTRYSDCIKYGTQDSDPNLVWDNKVTMILPTSNNSRNWSYTYNPIRSPNVVVGFDPSADLIKEHENLANN